MWRIFFTVVILSWYCGDFFQVNASDTRSKADTKIVKGVSGSTSNSIKELVNNEALSRNLNW